MFRVITTGENLNYGKRGERRLLNDSNMIVALKNGWISNKGIKFVGTQKTGGSVNYEEQLFPIKWISVERTLENIEKRIPSLTKEIKRLQKITSGLHKLIKERKNER